MSQFTSAGNLFFKPPECLYVNKPKKETQYQRDKREAMILLNEEFPGIKEDYEVEA